MARTIAANTSTPGEPVVVKIGGSLIDHIPGLVPVLRDSNRPLLIVPGGGVLANFIRDLQIQDEDAAHWMAVAAMEQFGWFIASNGLCVTDILDLPGSPTALLPYKCMRRMDPLPHSWNVTSDTIAAWIAGILDVDLLVLKSTDGITKHGQFLTSLERPVETDVVDPCFLPYVLEKKIRTTIINGSMTDRVVDFLEGRSVPGTVIGTTF